MGLAPAIAKPTLPFRPKTFGVIGPTRQDTTSRPKGPIYGPEKLDADGQVRRDAHGRPVREVIGWKQPGKVRPCWDLIITCDGHRWYDRHYAAGHAQSAKEELGAGFRQGWEFDPAARRFVAPSERTPASPTVFTEATAWWRAHWSTIEPKSRKETLRYIARPVRELVRPGPIPPSGLEEYITWQLLPPKRPEVPVPPEHAEAAAWLRAASMPIADADVAVWQNYVDRWRTNSRTGRPVAQATLNRHLADVKQMWGWVSAAHQLPNPWLTVKTGTRSSGGGRKGSTVRPIDRTIVLAPQHIRDLAALCGEGPFGPLAEVYILLLGIAGGRPGESAGVESSDFQLPAESVGEVRFRRTSRRGIDPSFLDADDDPSWGPLKGREIEDARVVPLPSRDALRIRQLLQENAARGQVFEGWDWEKFARDVWAPAKASMAALHCGEAGTESVEARQALAAALDRLRLHDLRHAACSMWLNTPGIEVRVACEWSGHRRLSVFLDIYQGIMPGSQESARDKLDAAWGMASPSSGAEPLVDAR